MSNAGSSVNVGGAVLSRRQFVKSGGTLVVGVGFASSSAVSPLVEAQRGGRNTPDPARASSWFTINADNTMVLHTGSVDFGQSSTTTAFKQIVAEELNFPYD